MQQGSEISADLLQPFINSRCFYSRYLDDMTKFQREKAELHKFVDIQSFANPTAVTLTMKMRVEGKSNDMETASTNFRHFMNRLNHTLLKSAAKRHGRRLKVFCARESNPDGIQTQLHTALRTRPEGRGESSEGVPGVSARRGVGLSGYPRIVVASASCGL